MDMDTFTNPEKAYKQGSRAAWFRILLLCYQELGYVDDPERKDEKWIVEREATIATLRNICHEFGDNDWDEDLHLADVIEKHLFWHLDQKEVADSRKDKP